MEKVKDADSADHWGRGYQIPISRWKHSAVGVHLRGINRLSPNEELAGRNDLGRKNLGNATFGNNQKTAGGTNLCWLSLFAN